jgi:Flp pilus assembly protein TadG
MTRFEKGQMFRDMLRRFSRHRRGNIAVVGALTAIPLTMGMGIGVDYAVAGFRQDQINGMADSATLAGVTPTMMSTATASASQTVAQNMFMAQLRTVPNIDLAHSNATVTSTDTSNGTTVTRTVTLHYTVASKAMFGQLLGMSALNISGQATAVSSTAPNINFWMLLDTSPSMAIAATTAGIATMVAATPQQGGCAFACHEVNPANDGLGNPGGEDNFALARNLGVTLRIDLVNYATQSLLNTAAATQMSYHTTYKFALYTMDINTAPYSTYGTPSVLTASQISALNISQLEVYNQSCVTQNNCNNDTDSYLDQAMNNLNQLMPNPGTGSNNVADTPQEVLFVVSDGVNDYVSGGSRIMSPISRNLNYCTAIKNRGIRIAYLYTTYNPLPTNGFYNSNIAPFQPQIATYAQNCASPGLFFQVGTDGDIAGAMQTLFSRAVATARLTV